VAKIIVVFLPTQMILKNRTLSFLAGQFLADLLSRVLWCLFARLPPVVSFPAWKERELLDMVTLTPEAVEPGSVPGWHRRHCSPDDR